MRVDSAIFVVALGLLFLEVFATRVLAIAVGSRYVFHTIAIAMLGLGAASAAVSLLRSLDLRRGLSLASICSLAAAAGALALFVGAALDAAASNAVLDAIAGSPGDYVRASLALDRRGILVVGALMMLPYAAIGAALALVLRVAPPALAGRWYGVDLLGACAGAVLAILALDHGSFAAGAFAACLFPALAAVLFAVAAGVRRIVWIAAAGSLAVAGLVLAAAAAGLLEPRPAISSVARIWEEGGGAREIWSTWTSYGRIAALETQQGFEVSTVMAHGRGEGHARVVEPGQELEPRPLRLLRAAEAAIASCEPDRVLVLFAGAGADMRIIDRLAGGRSRIRGVELVGEVFEWPAGQPRFGLREFLDRPGIDLVAAEAREFLARDPSRYDCILMSWFGASLSYFTGTNSHTMSSIYTVEGLAEVLRHLDPQGQLTILSGDKAQVILTMLEALRATGVEDPTGSLLLLSSRERSREYEHSIVDWLVVKPAGFDEADRARLGAVTGRTLIALSPDDPDEFHSRLVRDPEAMVRSLVEERGTDVSPATDDRPFPDNLVPASALLSARFWRGDFRDLPGVVAQQWQYDREQMFATLGFVAISLLLILGPVLVQQLRSGRWPEQAGNELAYFAAVGAGFMLIEIGLIQKLRLLVGHPGHTVAVVLASILSFTGVGSLVSRATHARPWASIRMLAVLVAATTVVMVALLEACYGALVGLPYAGKLLVAFLVPAIPCLFMGHLFPLGLTALRGGPLVSWAIAVNAVTGTIVTGLGIFLGKHVGYRNVIWLGCGFYLLLAVLSQRRREERLRSVGEESVDSGGAESAPAR